MNPILGTLLADPFAGMLIVDAAGKIRRANDTLRHMTAPGVDLSAGADMAAIFSHDERAAIRCALTDILADGTPRTLLSRLRTATADPHHAVAITALPLPEDDTFPGRLVLRIVDVTAQRRLEAQLAHGQKLQAVGQLAGGIAHDFNNLLTAILGAAEMVRDRPNVDMATQEDVAQIARAAQRGGALVRQLLAFGRQQTLQPRIIAINTAIRDVAAMLRPLLGAQVTLVLDLDSGEPLAKVDPTQLDQVLVNLAMNARHAMPAGGTLTLHSGHVTLYRPLTRGAETIPPGSYVMVEVRDTGAGIPPEVMARIFEPFFTTRRDQGGTGLGLAMVHGIVRQSEGFLTVDSSPGQGTSLRIYLPRHTGTAEPAAAIERAVPPPAAASAASVLPVLLVDDEAMVRDLMTRALQQRGWRVLACDSAESALARLESSPPGPLAAVISDVVMPGMDGPALVRALRTRQPGLPAILISGYAEESLRATLTADEISFLPKSYALKDLLALLAEISGAAQASPPAR